MSDREAAIEAAAKWLYEHDGATLARASRGEQMPEWDDLNIVVRKAFATKVEGSRAAYEAALAEQPREEISLRDLTVSGNLMRREQPRGEEERENALTRVICELRVALGPHLDPGSLTDAVVLNAANQVYDAIVASPTDEEERTDDC